MPKIKTYPTRLPVDVTGSEYVVVTDLAEAKTYKVQFKNFLENTTGLGQHLQKYDHDDFVTQADIDSSMNTHLSGYNHASFATKTYVDGAVAGVGSVTQHELDWNHDDFATKVYVVDRFNDHLNQYDHDSFSTKSYVDTTAEAHAVAQISAHKIEFNHSTYTVQSDIDTAVTTHETTWNHDDFVTATYVDNAIVSAGSVAEHEATYDHDLLVNLTQLNSAISTHANISYDHASFVNQGDIDTTISTTNIGELNDVTIDNPDTAQVLTYNTGQWINADISAVNPFDQDLNTTNDVGFKSVVADGDIAATDAFIQYTWGDATWVDSYKMVTYEPWTSPMATHRWLLIRAESDWSKSSRHDFRISATESEHRIRFDNGVTDTRVDSTANATSAGIHLQTNTYTSDFEMIEADIGGTTNAYILRVNSAFDFTTTNKWLIWAGVTNTVKFSVDFDGNLDIASGANYSIGGVPLDFGGLHTHTNKANLDEIDQDLSTTGYPTFAGISRCSRSTNASDAVTIGFGAGNETFSGSLNVAIGFAAGLALTTGNNNTFIGWTAGANTSSGTSNVAIGPAANSGTTGDTNVAIGLGAGGNLTTGGNNLFLGANAGGVLPDPTRSNFAMIGGITGSGSELEVGIGTNNPQYRLDVDGDVNATGAYRTGGTAGVSGTFTTTDGKTITISNGIVTNIVT